MEVTPLTLGVSSTENYIMTPIIKRNTPIPVSRTENYFTLYDNQTRITFPIIQGERHFAKDNFEIGKVRIDGIAPAPRGVERATVTFSIDANGILTVTAVSESNENNRGEMTIKNACGCLTKAEIDRMVADAENFRKHDNEVKQFYTARSELEQYCYEIKQEYGWKNEAFSEKCDEVLLWLSKCCRPTVAQFAQKKVELQALTNPPKNDSAKKCKRTTKAESTRKCKKTTKAESTKKRKATAKAECTKKCKGTSKAENCKRATTSMKREKQIKKKMK